MSQQNNNTIQWCDEVTRWSDISQKMGLFRIALKRSGATKQMPLVALKAGTFFNGGG